MSSYSTNSSYSTTSPVETPENSIIDQISGVASGLAQQMNAWAQQTFAQTSAVTNEAVNNFFQASQSAMGTANSLTSQYNNLFAPENQQLVQDANDYASTPHMQADMGMAGATQAQAGDAAVKNSEANLVSMGIDPSSGRYAALDKAAAVQNAANVAGAENNQRQQDIQTGQALRSEAVQVGSQLPGAIANLTNTAIQANTGASNASLGNANTGANLNSLADKYLQTAMGVKLPFSSNQGGSTGQSTGQKPGQSSSGGGGNGGGNGGGQNPSGGTTWSGMTPNSAAQGTDGGGGGGRGQPGSSITSINPYGNNDYNVDGMYGSDSIGGVDASQWENNDSYQSDPNGAQGSIGSQQYDPTQYTQNNPFGDSGFGQTYGDQSSDGTFGGMGGGTNTEYGNISYDPSANSGGDTSGFGDYSQPDSSSFDSGGGNAFQDYGYTSPDMSGGSDDSSTNYSGGGGDDDGYAGGGSVQATSGGMVPPSASPSGGARTDDVRANVNANEFIVPKDVAKWKGEEFFHNLIAQSRQKRLKMQSALGTGGKPMPAGDPRAQGKPTFQSRPQPAMARPMPGPMQRPPMMQR